MPREANADTALRRVRIVSTAPLPPVAEEALAHIGDVWVASDGDREVFQEAEVLIARGGRVGERLLAQAPALRVIARTGSGLDNVSLDAATRRGIPVVYAPEAGTLAMAEGTIALILAAAKHLRELSGVLTDGRWEARYDHDLLDIAGSTLGVVGFGRIGREVARLALALGMRVIAYDRDERVAEAHAGEVAVATSLGDLCAQADVITLHCPLDASTRGLVDARLLEETKRGAILINASRGEVIADEELLIDALDQGQLSAVALDVYAVEPPPAQARLLHDPRVICTPHTVGLSRSWNRSVFQGLAADVERVLSDRRPRHLANPEVFAAARR